MLENKHFFFHIVSISNEALAFLLSALQAVADPAFNPHPSQTSHVFENCFKTCFLIVFPPEIQSHGHNLDQLLCLLNCSSNGQQAVGY